MKLLFMCFVVYWFLAGPKEGALLKAPRRQKDAFSRVWSLGVGPTHHARMSRYASAPREQTVSWKSPKGIARKGIGKTSLKTP